MSRPNLLWITSLPITFSRETWNIRGSAPSMTRFVRDWEESSIEYHQRQASRFRRLAATATTPAIKTLLLMQAEEHDRTAAGENEPIQTETGMAD
jgi:hypothetical protein